MQNDAYRRFAPTALMLGNFVTGTSILGPAGMLRELASGLDVTVSAAGTLITFGAVVLCICSPLTAWLTSRIERHTLLAFTLAVFAIGNAASAFAPDYATLLVIRLMMLAVGALFTPQAAGTAAFIVPPEKRGGAITYIFLGWSFATLLGLPMVTFLASRYGWQSAYLGIALLAACSFMLLVWRLPRGLVGAPVDLRTWIELGRNPLVSVLLLVTILLTSGQFAILTYLGPLLTRLTEAGPDAIGMVFITNGVFGVIGNVIASRLVDPWGSYRTSILFVALLLAGACIWAAGAGHFAVMASGIGVLGLGFASVNSMQQIRLIGAAPAYGPAAVSLNTSGIYIGQAIGSATCGALYARDMLQTSGFVAAGFLGLALIIVIWTGRFSETFVGRVESALPIKDASL